LVLVSLAPMTLAGPQDRNVNSGLTAVGTPLAIHGYDPVGYFTENLATVGSAKYTAKHAGAAYRFASAANKKAFDKNPTDYLPQYGGFCAYGVSVNKKFDGDPRVFKIVGGKLYFNLNPDIKAEWVKDIRGNIGKANGHWQKLQDKPVDDASVGDKQNVGTGLTGAGAPLAIHGYDSVAYFTDGLSMPGSAKHTATHNGAAYRFVSKANKKAFEKDPASFLPQYGGFCAFGVSVGKKFDGDPRVFEVVDGKLYFNLNPDIKSKWVKDIPGNVRKADRKWTDIRAKSVAAL
jgi:YHS domain-containing protein